MYPPKIIQLCHAGLVDHPKLSAGTNNAHHKTHAPKLKSASK